MPNPDMLREMLPEEDKDKADGFARIFREGLEKLSLEDEKDLPDAKAQQEILDREIREAVELNKKRFHGG